MATLIHESPLGDLEIPTVLEPVSAGVPFDVDDDIALSLLTQGDLFRLAAPPKLNELRALAKDAEVDHTGLDRHQLVTALAIADVSAALTNDTAAAETAPTEEATA